MTGRWTLFVALALALLAAPVLTGADTALEKTVERAKDKRSQDLEKAGNFYHTAVERANKALARAYETAIAAAKRKKDDAKVESLTKDMEAVETGGSPSTTETGNPLLDGAIKRHTVDMEQAEKAFKVAVDRANKGLEQTFNIAIAGYKRKSDARGEELASELATIKAEEVTPTKTESAEAEPKGNGSQELIRTVGDTLITADNKKVPSKLLASKEFVLVYFSASWCGPCRNFTPSLVEFHKEHAKAGRFDVLFVSSCKSEKDMLGYMSEDKMGFLAVPHDKVRDTGLMKTHNVSGIPHLVVLDKNGKVVSSPGGAASVLAEFKQKLGIKN